MATRAKDVVRGRTSPSSSGGDAMTQRCAPPSVESRPKRVKVPTCPNTREVVMALAAHAHHDAERNDKDAALRHDVDRRTANRWRGTGKGSPADAYALYVLNCARPFRMAAHEKALAKRVEIKDESREELVRRTRELLAKEKITEGQDSACDLSRGISWTDRAALKERDAAIDEELAARFRRLAELRVPESEVFG